MDKLSAAGPEFRKLGMRNGTTAGYTAIILGGGQPQPRDLALESDDDNNDDNSPVLGPQVFILYQVARMARKSHFILFVSNPFANVIVFQNVNTHRALRLLLSTLINPISRIYCDIFCKIRLTLMLTQFE
jgi:hypothetical protein